MNQMKNSMLLCIFFALLAPIPCSALVNSVTDLYTAIEASTNKKVGFVAKTNYDSVAKVLPSDVEPVYPYTDVKALEADVLSGKLFAGFITSDTPSGHFNYFSSRIVSGQGMFTLGNPWLLKVLNAAITQVQLAGAPQSLVRSYSGKVFTEIDTCGTTPGAFPWPSASDLSVSGESWWCGSGGANNCINGNNQYIRIGTIYNKFSWFYDYTVNPPTGFFADYYGAINDAILKQYAPQNFLGFQRVIDQTKTTSTVLLANLAASASPSSAPFDATDVFFFYTSTFTGTVAQTGKQYTGVARTTVFQSTCVVIGGDGSFFTKVELNQDAPPPLSSGAIAGIVVGAVVGLSALIFSAVMVVRERAGRPMFTKLIDQEPTNAVVESSTYEETVL